MPIIKNVGKELLDVYDGYQDVKVGAGTDPGMYATPAYAKKKIQTLLLGNLTKVVYSGYDHKMDPLIIPMVLEPSYNTIMGISLSYVPLRTRQNIIKFILESNAARIKSNLPLIIDYPSIKRMIPESQFIVRRYKTVLLRVEESFRLTDWDNAIKEEGDAWANHWRAIKDGKIK